MLKANRWPRRPHWGGARVKGLDMANICCHELYMIAVPEVMHKVLGLMAAHLKNAGGEDVVDKVTSAKDWQAAAKVLKKATRNVNKLCLVADKPDTGAEGGNLSWWDGPALLAEHEGFGPVSDGSGAVAQMAVLNIDLELKWGPTYQFGKFFEEVAEAAGPVGFAAIQGGEYVTCDCDCLEEAHVYYQLGPSVGDPHSGARSYGEMMELTSRVREDGMAASEPNEYAEVEMLGHCDTYGFFDLLLNEEEEDEYYEEEEEDKYWQDFKHYLATDFDDYELIDEAMLSILQMLPSPYLLDSRSFVERAESFGEFERLVPGNQLVLTVNWHLDEAVRDERERTEEATAFNIATVSGTPIGRGLHIGVAYYDGTYNDYALALLLPHISVTITQVLPMSLRTAGANGPEMEILLSLEATDIAAVLEDAHALLRKPLAERTVSTRITKGRE
jgi:hypothetical protein